MDRLVLAVSIALFGISLMIPAFCNSSCHHGFYAAVFGWATLGLGGANITWLANPLLWFSWLLVLREDFKLAAIVSGASACVMLLFLFFDQVSTNEAGIFTDITEIEFGFWIWVTSASLIVVVSCFELAQISAALEDDED